MCQPFPNKQDESPPLPRQLPGIINKSAGMLSPTQTSQGKKRVRFLEQSSPTPGNNSGALNAAKSPAKGVSVCCCQLYLWIDLVHLLLFPIVKCDKLIKCQLFPNSQETSPTVPPADMASSQVESSSREVEDLDETFDHSAGMSYLKAEPCASSTQTSVRFGLQSE